jgi:hypothetical protein
VPAGGPGPAEHAELADSLSMAFLVLLETLSAGGDMDALLGMLAPDVVFHGDGGGKAQAIRGERLQGQWDFFVQTAHPGEWDSHTDWAAMYARSGRPRVMQRV